MGTSCRDWPRLEGEGGRKAEKKKWGGGKRGGNEMEADEEEVEKDMRWKKRWVKRKWRNGRKRMIK